MTASEEVEPPPPYTPFPTEGEVKIGGPKKVINEVPANQSSIEQVQSVIEDSVLEQSRNQQVSQQQQQLQTNEVPISTQRKQ